MDKLTNQLYDLTLQNNQLTREQNISKNPKCVFKTPWHEVDVLSSREEGPRLLLRAYLLSFWKSLHNKLNYAASKPTVFKKGAK